MHEHLCEAVNPRGNDVVQRCREIRGQFPSARSSPSPGSSSSAWGDRVRALKNIPPVLHFVWESGPSVVFWNIAIRIVVAFLPVGIGIIGRFIIDGVNRIRFHQPLPQDSGGWSAARWRWRC